MPPARRGDRRKVDDLGRVVIPAGIRRSLDIGVGDEVDVSVEGGQVVLTPTAETCVFCDVTTDLDMFRGKAVCWSCAAAMRALDRERAGEAPPPPF
ncbi:MAG: AbrB/MazE/SpoVT family DNA-binding domain-containing protein [Egibacteraceae bacterium]